MCEKYVAPDVAEVERIWAWIDNSRTLFDPPCESNFNVAPTARIPIVIRDRESGRFDLVPATWGLIPVLWKEPKPPRFTFNARLEEAATKPMWEPYLARSRCLVPAMGWYEWRKVDVADPRTGEIKHGKQPHFIRSANEPIFAFAGVMSARKSADETLTYSCAIMTTAAAPSVSDVHDRMPVVLPVADQKAWMDPHLDARTASALARAVAETNFNYYRVSDKVNSARDHDASLIEPLAA